MSNRADSKAALRSALFKLALLAFAGACLLLVAHLLNVQAYLRQALEWISGLGTTGILIYIVIFILVSVLFLPCFLLSVGAGVIWGTGKGLGIVMIASTLGATTAFLVSRYAIRGWVTRKLGADERFRAIDDAVAREGWKIVGLTRLAPVFPYFVMNYLYGITRVPIHHYIPATIVGMVPSSLMLVYMGSMAGTIANLGAKHERTALEWAFYGFGLIATVIATWLITKTARKALAGKTTGTSPAAASAPTEQSAR